MPHGSATDSGSQSLLVRFTIRTRTTEATEITRVETAHPAIAGVAAVSSLGSQPTESYPSAALFIN